MDAKDIELVAKITKEQEDWKKSIKAVEAQVLVLLTTINKAAMMCDRWWLDLAKQQCLSGLSAAINAISVPITEKNLTDLKNYLAQAEAAKVAQASQEAINNALEPQVTVIESTEPIEPSGDESAATEAIAESVEVESVETVVSDAVSPE